MCFDAFDFALTSEQHCELYLAGQLATHLHAAQMASLTLGLTLEGEGTAPVMSDENKLKTLLYLAHMDYPQ
ncbi:MAG: hypothetical protein SGPRY_007856 [Prymnesium sp.]